MAAGSGAPGSGRRPHAATADARGGVAGVGGSGAIPTRGRSAARRSASSPSRPATPTYPAPLRRRPASHRRCCSSAATSPCSTPGGSASSAPATPPQRGRDDRLRARPRARRGRRRGGVGPGQGHRRRGPPWRAGRAAAAGRSPSSATAPTGRTRSEHTDLWARGLRARAADLRVAAGHAARAVPLPAAQPDPRRAERGAGGRREPRARRHADHGRRRRSSGDRRHGRARLGRATGPRPAPTSCSATAPRRSRASTTCSSRSASTTGGPGATAVRPAAAAARRRGRRAGRVPRRSAHARRRRRPRSRCRWPTPRWRSPASSARAGSARPAAGSNRWCRGPADDHDRIPSAVVPRISRAPSTDAPASTTADDASAVWRVDDFAASLTSLSPTHRRGLRLRRAWLRRRGRRAPASPSPAPCAGTILRRYLAHLTTRQYARRSIARKAAALRRYFQWLVRAGHRRGRSDGRRCRPAAATAGCRGCSTRRDLDELLDGRDARRTSRTGAARATTPCSRCSTAPGCASASCAGSTSARSTSTGAR